MSPYEWIRVMQISEEINEVFSAVPFPEYPLFAAVPEDKVLEHVWCQLKQALDHIMHRQKELLYPEVHKENKELGLTAAHASQKYKVLS